MIIICINAYLFGDDLLAQVKDLTGVNVCRIKGQQKVVDHFPDPYCVCLMTVLQDD